jgi:hypothetical protein
MRWLLVTVMFLGLLPAGTAHAAGGPRYDVPSGYTRCPKAVAWNGFFKWASAKDASCAATARFLRTYAAHAGKTLPRHVDGYDCRIHYWRNSDGDIYASRHECARGAAMIRFYGMV